MITPARFVSFANDMVGPVTFTADDEGSFGTDQAAGDVGVLSFIVGTEIIFDVTATDSDGQPLRSSGRLLSSTRP